MLIITGTLAYDYIMDFPGKFGDHILPESLHKLNLSFIVSNFEKRRGGTAGNVSYSLGLLDTKNILFSVAGNDFTEYGKELLRLGVDVSHIKVDKRMYTATGFAMTDKIDNQIWGYFYGAAERITDLKLKEVAASSDFVLIGPSGAKGSLSLIHQCVEQQIPYMFDPGFILTQISDEDLAFGVRFGHSIIGNDYEIDLMQKRIPEWKKLTKEKIVITTLSDKGAVITQGDKTLSIGIAKPTKVADPTGAGDSWRAGFLAGYVRGKDLKTCGQMGAVVASFALEHYGTQEHKFSIAAFLKRYKENFGETITL